MEVKIPFLKTSRPVLLSGDKTCTTRYRKYGDSGDVFPAFDSWFRILFVMRLPLGVVAKYFHKPEGFNSEEEFMDCWTRIHPRRGNYLSDLVYMHVFVRRQRI